MWPSRPGAEVGLRAAVEPLDLDSLVLGLAEQWNPAISCN